MAPNNFKDWWETEIITYAHCQARWMWFMKWMQIPEAFGEVFTLMTSGVKTYSHSVGMC